MVLEKINGPQDIKQLNCEELHTLADETRHYLLQAAGVEVAYHQLLDMIPNHDKIGECPLEQRLHGITDYKECLLVIDAFVKTLP